MTIGSLFSGIGGLDLGLEWAGLGPVVWQVEPNLYCRRVLARHWPHAQRFLDVRTTAHLAYVDVICGGFPCQDVSAAGLKAGLAGESSGLWRDFARVVDRVRPRAVVVENVASGKRLWLPSVRRDLHLLGYDTTAYALSANDVGAPHLRRRIFVVAHAQREQLRDEQQRQPARCADGVRDEGEALARHDGAAGNAPADAEGERRATARPRGRGPARDADGDGQSARAGHGGALAGLRPVASDASGWAPAPDLRGVDDGLPDRVDSIAALGNAVVPLCAEVVGRIVRELLEKYRPLAA